MVFLLIGISMHFVTLDQLGYELLPRYYMFLLEFRLPPLKPLIELFAKIDLPLKIKLSVGMQIDKPW